MENGWIKLHRKILENPIIQKPNYFALWVVLLLKANHKDKKMIWNNNIIIIKEGQFVTGRKVLSDETGIPESTIEDVLNFLENQQQIRQQKTTKYRLITIINWKDYQTSNNKATTKQQQADTNKNDNNDNNDKKERGSSYLKEIPEEDLKEFHDRFDCTISAIKDKAESLYLYCQAKGKVYKNYKAFLLNALKKDFPKRINYSQQEVKNLRKEIPKEVLQNYKPNFLK